MPVRSGLAPSWLLCWHRAGPSSWAVLGPRSRLSAAAPRQGSGSREGGWLAVGASRDAEVTWNDREVDVVSLGHTC